MDLVIRHRAFRAQPFPLDDELHSALSDFPLDEDVPAALYRQPPIWVVTTSVDTAADDIGTAVIVIPVPIEDEAAAPFTINFSPWSAVSFLSDEIGSALVNFGLDQEDDYSRLQTLITWTPLVFSDENAGATLEGFGLDQEEPWKGERQMGPWLPSPFLDDESGSSLLNFYSEHEDDYSRQREVVAWYPITFLDDEIGSTLAGFPFQDDSDFNRQPQINPWLAMPYLGDEIGSPLTNFYSEQEEPWVVMTEALPWTARVSTDEEIRSSIVQFGMDEDPLRFESLVPFVVSPFNRLAITSTFDLGADDPFKPTRTADKPFLSRLPTDDPNRLRRFSEHLMSMINALVAAGNIVQLGATSYAIRAGAFTAARAPGANDDVTTGVLVGSSWVDSANGKVYFCVDNTVRAAVWNGPY